MALRDWIESTPVANANPAKIANAAKVEIQTPTGPRILRITHLGEPTQAEIDVADSMLAFIAEHPEPVAAAVILAAVEGDEIWKRNILHRLVVDGMAELTAPGFYTIPSYPPAPANLPKGCPLLGGTFPETGCRFHRKLFNTLWKQGALPLPNGGCPLRGVCKLGQPG